MDVDQKALGTRSPGDSRLSGSFPFIPSSNWTEVATGWIWIGALRTYAAHGLLFRQGLAELPVLFCPDDRNMVADEQLANTGSDVDAYGTYGYRHLDQTTRDLLDDLGRNEMGQPARALLFDMISDGPFPLVQRITHDRRFVNVAYTQGHVLRLTNRNNSLYFAPSDFAGFPMSFARRLDQVLVNADFGERGDPASAPTLGPMPP